jgi:hypothetical protein
VFRYAWFTSCWSHDVHYTSLFNANAGELTAVGSFT